MKFPDKFIWSVEDLIVENKADRFASRFIIRFNPYHKPAGSPEGGEFAEGKGGSAQGGKGDKSKKKPKDKATIEDDNDFVKGVKEGDYGDADFVPVGTGEYSAEIVTYANGQRGIRKAEFFDQTDPLQDGNLEVSAYRLSSRLGLDVVPPTDFYSYGGVGGRATVQKFIENSDIIASKGTKGIKEFFENNQEQVGKILLLDYLNGNSDRHYANIVIDKFGKAWAIDNGNSGSKYGTYTAFSRKFPSLDFDKMVKKNSKLIKSWGKITRNEFDSWFDGVSEKKNFKKKGAWERMQELIQVGGFPE